MLVSLDDSVLIDGDLSSTIESSMLIDLSTSFANLDLLLSEVGFSIVLFSSFGCHSASLSVSNSD